MEMMTPGRLGQSTGRCCVRGEECGVARQVSAVGPSPTGRVGCRRMPRGLVRPVRHRLGGSVVRQALQRDRSAGAVPGEPSGEGAIGTAAPEDVMLWFDACGALLLADEIAIAQRLVPTHAPPTVSPTANFMTTTASRTSRRPLQSASPLGNSTVVADT